MASNDGSVPTMHYFPVCARQFCYDLTMAAGEKKSEFDSLTFQKWMGGFKQQCQFGQCPVVTFKGQQICQTAAIERFAARMAGMYPASIEAAAKVDMIYEQLREIAEGFYKAKFSGGANWGPDPETGAMGFVCSDAPAQQAAYDAHFVKAMELLAPLADILKQSKSGFFIGYPTYVDVKLYTVLRNLESAGCSDWRTEKALVRVFDAVPKLGACEAKIKEIEQTYLLVHRPGSHQGF